LKTTSLSTILFHYRRRTVLKDSAQFGIEEFAKCKYIIGGLLYSQQMKYALPLIKCYQITNLMVYEVTVAPLSYNLYPQLFSLPTQAANTVRSAIVGNQFTHNINEIRPSSRKKFRRIIKELSRCREQSPFPIAEYPSQVVLPHVLLYPELGQHWFLDSKVFVDRSLKPSINKWTKGLILCYPAPLTDLLLDFNGVSIASGLDINMGKATLDAHPYFNGLKYELKNADLSVTGSLMFHHNRGIITDALMRLGFSIYSRTPTVDHWVKR
jgi:hypothetical protein